jgi:hypothetical protein
VAIYAAVENLKPGGARVYRFGDYELDVAAYQLRRGGRPVRLGAARGTC